MIKTEFGGEKQNLREFVMPTIMSVFVWMVAISYLLLAIVMDKTKKQSRIIFNDQDLNQARKRLKETLQRRLAEMDDRSSRVRTLKHAKPHQSKCLITEETISLSDSVNQGQNRRRTMPPAEIDLGRSMRGRRVLPIDSLVMTVTESDKHSKLQGKEEPVGESFVGPKRNLLPPIIPRPMLPKESPDAPRKPELPPKPNILPVDAMERRNKWRKVESSNKSSFPPNPDSGEVEGESDALNESTTATVKSGSSLSALLAGDGTGCWAYAKRVYHFFMETKEYADPHQYGWRIKFRRAFLSVGVVMFTYLTVYTAVSTQNFSSKVEIQQFLDYAGANLTWPDSGSVLDVSKTEYDKITLESTHFVAGRLPLVQLWAANKVVHNGGQLDSLLG